MALGHGETKGFYLYAPCIKNLPKIRRKIERIYQFPPRKKLKLWRKRAILALSMAKILWDYLPLINICLNASSGVCVALAARNALRGSYEKHKFWIKLALLLSAMFLVGYLYFHAHVGHVEFHGEGRALYLAVLISHVILSVALAPWIILQISYARSKSWENHKKYGPYLVAIWLYVSITGVGLAIATLGEKIIPWRG